MAGRGMSWGPGLTGTHLGPPLARWKTGPAKKANAGGGRERYLGVDDLVAAEGAGLAESFAADLADEGPGARVHRHVAGQVVVRVEDLQERARRDQTGSLGGGRRRRMGPCTRVTCLAADLAGEDLGLGAGRAPAVVGRHPFERQLLRR